MANIPLKTIRFPGLSDVYTVPVVDDSLQTPGAAADAKKTGNEISQLKEDLNELEDALSVEEARAKSEEERIESLFTQPIDVAVDTWLTEHPEATTTVQDGSLTLAKFTSDVRAKITDVKNVFNVLNYGVKNTNVGDQSAAINAVIAMCAEGDTVYLPTGTYRIENPIIVNKAINFVCDGFIRIVLSQAGFGVAITKSYANVYVRYAQALNSQSGCIKIEAESEAVQFVTLEFDRLEGTSSGAIDTISVISGSYYTAYIVIRGKRIYGSSNANCISCLKNGNATLGEIHIEEARIDHGKNGLYISDDAFNATSDQSVNSVCAINCIFENNANACYIKNAKSIYLMNCRVVEQMNIEQGRYFLTLEGRIIQGGYVGRTNVRAKAIRLIDLDNTISCRSAFYINAPIYLSDIDDVPKVGGLIYGGKLYVIPTTVEAVE